MFGLHFAGEPISFEPVPGKKQYQFRRLHLIHDEQLDRDDPDQSDSWSMYLPSRVSGTGATCVD